MPTSAQLAQALQAADAAGNTDDAKQLAQAYKQQLASEQSAAPVTAPVSGSGATQGDVLYGQGSTAPRSDSETMFQKVNDFGNDAGDAFVHHLGNLPVGIAQLFGHGVTAAANAALPADSGIRQSLNATNNNFDQYAADREKAYQAAVPTNTASILGATGGEALPFAFEAPAKGLQAIGNAAKILPDAGNIAARIGNKVLSGTAQGATVAAAQPVTSGPATSPLASLVSGESPIPSFASQKLGQIGVGALTGGALSGVPAIGRELIGTASPEVQALAQKAAQYGIDLTGPQISKSVPLKVANSTTAPIPFSGATAAAEKQQGQFNNAVAQTIGLPQGTTKITPDVFAKAKQAIGQGYDDLAARNNLTIDPPLVSKIQQIVGEAHTDGDPDAARAISNITQELIGKASMNGSSLTGTQFQSLDSRLGRLAASPGGGDKAHYAGELQDVLRQSMEGGMSPADAVRSAELRSQWRNALNLTPVLTSGTGDVAPSRLLSAVANNKAGKTQLATGNRGDLGTLAQIGKQFMTDPVPNSGTALRNMGMDTLKGLGAVGAGSVVGVPAATALPAAAGTVIAARLIQQGLRSRALYNAIANLPQAQQGPVRTAVNAMLASQSAQNINRLNTAAPSANNISGNP